MANPGPVDRFSIPTTSGEAVTATAALRKRHKEASIMTVSDLKKAVVYYSRAMEERKLYAMTGYRRLNDLIPHLGTNRGKAKPCFPRTRPITLLSNVPNSRGCTG